MKLYGRYLSPFVRRVGASLNVLGLPFEHKILSVVDHADEIREINPLVRVPALEFDDGSRLIESWAILDALDELVGPEKALVPPSGAARRDVLQLVSFAMGACEKTVSAYYERIRRPKEFCYENWAAQCEAQVRGAFGLLDARAEDRVFLAGERLTQADISAVCAFDFAAAVLPDQLAPAASWPHLAALSDRVNAIEAVGKTKPTA